MARKGRQEAGEQTLEGAELMAAAEAAIEAENHATGTEDPMPEAADDGAGTGTWTAPVFDEPASGVDEAGAEAFAHPSEAATGLEVADVPDEAAHAMDEVVDTAADDAKDWGTDSDEAVSGDEPATLDEAVTTDEAATAEAAETANEADGGEETADAMDDVESDRGATQELHATE